MRSLLFRASFYDIIPTMIRTYELMLVVRPDFPVEDTKKRDDLIQKLMKSAKIVDVTVLGKKHLAYPIRKQTEGIYILIHLTGDSIKTGDVQKEAKLGTDIIRFLLLEREA